MLETSHENTTRNHDKTFEPTTMKDDRIL